MFRYIDDKTFCRRGNKSNDHPCYRLLVSYAFFELHKENSEGLERTKCEFEQLLVARDNNYTYKNDFLEFYVFNANPENDSDMSLLDEEEIGHIYVAHPQACFPLMLYPYSNTDFCPRKTAFNVALKDLYNNIDSIIQEFDNHQDVWNEKLQEQLIQYFNFPS